MANFCLYYNNHLPCMSFYNEKRIFEMRNQEYNGDTELHVIKVYCFPKRPSCIYFQRRMLNILFH